MQKLTTTAAIAFGVFLAIVPAQAEHGAGSVMQKGHQCYNHTKGAEDRENGFAYLCRRGACLVPVGDGDALLEALDSVVAR